MGFSSSLPSASDIAFNKLQIYSHTFFPSSILGIPVICSFPLLNIFTLASLVAFITTFKEAQL